MSIFEFVRGPAMSTVGAEPISVETFSGQIRVASRIIDYLSSGLYRSPAACLKELVNNSFDADAIRVDVLVKPDADRIIIEDDGMGMSKDEFTSHFSRVTESHKRDGGERTAGGRPKIGKIGIGFIAANEICEVMEIFSTKQGSTDLLHVTIDFAEMRKPPEERRSNGTDYVKADFTGELLKADVDAHFTQLFLTSIRGEARAILAGASTQTQGSQPRSLYGLGAEAVTEMLRDPTLRTWKEFDPYSETLLHVALNVPVPYYPGWLPPRLRTAVIDLEEQVAELNFHVYYDGTPLGKPTAFSPSQESAFISRFNFVGEYVSARGYFYAQHGNIRPHDLHGLLVRIRQAAVGEYDPSFWGFSLNEATLIQRWISAEIWADDRLEAAMNIDRQTLRDAHPAYVELRHAVHRHLREVVRQARAQIYEAGNLRRREQRTREAISAVEGVARQVVAPRAPAVARRLEQVLEKAGSSSSTQKALQRKYTLPDLYRIIVDAAAGLLSEEQLAALLDRITERLDR